MRSSNNSAYKYDIKSPLIGRISTESRKTFTPTKLLFDIEYKHPTCKTKCSTVCSKTVYKDFIRLENEDMESLNPFKFSINSIIVALFTLFMYCFQFAYYRKTVNTYIIERLKHTHEFIKELSFYCWRIQSVCLFFIVFINIARYITDKYNQSQKITLEDKITNENKKANIHCFVIDWKNLICFKNLKFALINSICYFIQFGSTKFLPLGVCFFLNNSGMLIGILITKKNQKTYLKHFLFLLFGFTFVYFSLDKDFTELKYRSIFDFQIISIILYILSSTFQVFTQRENMNEILLTNSPIAAIAIIQINSLILSSSLLMIIEIFHYKLSFYEMFIWLLNWNNFMTICFAFGFLGLINSLLTIFSSVYLKTNFLKLIKILEIPFSDFLAFSLFQIYSIPTHSDYYLAITNFIIYLAYIQFSIKNK